MAQMVRRHWAWVLALPVFLAALLLAMMQSGNDTRKARAQEAMGSGVPQAAAAPVPQPLPQSFSPQQRSAAQAYQQVQHLRTELVLTSPDMAALGLSSAGARELLNALQAFAVSDAGAMASADAAIRQARQALQEASRKINVGPRDETVLASVAALKQSIAAAQAQRDLVMAGIIGQVNTLLTSDQQALWQAARSNATTAAALGIAAPGPYRYVGGLTDTQVERLDAMARQRGAAGLEAAGSDLLDAAQSNQMQIARQNQRIAAAAVAAAEAQVLPVPEMLKPVLIAKPATSQPNQR